MELYILIALSALSVVGIILLSCFGCHWCMRNDWQSEKLDTLIKASKDSHSSFATAYQELSSKLDEREKAEDPSRESLVDQKVNQLERKSEQLQKEIESLQKANDVLIRQVAKLQVKEAKKVRIGNTVPVEIHHGN